MNNFLGLLFFLISGFAYSIEIKTEESFYPVTLKIDENVFTTIYKSAPRSNKHFMHAISNKIIGEYQPRIDIGVGYSVYRNNTCKIKEVDITLLSAFLLPRLNSSERIPSSLIKEFQREFHKIRDHERAHESNYINELKTLKQEIFDSGSQKADCDFLKTTVQELETQTFARLEMENLKFDCREYGYEMGLDECERIYQP